MRIGDYIGPYRLVRLLAQGGMGAVYEARNDLINRRVAIKLLHPNLASDPEYRQRFFNEARAVNLVNHPNLATVHEYGAFPDGSAYTVMEYCEGHTLAQRLRARNGEQLPLSQVIRIGRQIAAALATAHYRGIVHRDLKPENLMLVADPDVPGGERIKILDFGIAKVRNNDASSQGVTRIGTGMGTPGYVAPEQIYGASSVDSRADVYSLGVVLYELLSGSRPFLSKDGDQELLSHLTRVPPPLLERRPGIPPGLAALVHTMLAKQAAARPGMCEVAEHLHSIEFSTPGAIFMGQQAEAPRRVSVSTVTGAALVTLLLAGCLFFMEQSWTSRMSNAPSVNQRVAVPNLISPMPSFPGSIAPAAPFPGTLAAAAQPPTPELPLEPLPQDLGLDQAEKEPVLRRADIPPLRSAAVKAGGITAFGANSGAGVHGAGVRSASVHPPDGGSPDLAAAASPEQQDLGVTYPDVVTEGPPADLKKPFSLAPGATSGATKGHLLNENDLFQLR
jgi:serine/threonine protein kinase